MNQALGGVPRLKALTVVAYTTKTRTAEASSYLSARWTVRAAAERKVSPRSGPAVSVLRPAPRSRTRPGVVPSGLDLAS